MDSKTLERWSREYAPGIRSFLVNRYNVPREEARDIVQMVWMRVLSYPSDQTIANPRSYLTRIAINVANEWRDRCCNCRHHLDISDMCDSDPIIAELIHDDSLDIDLIISQRNAHIRAVINSLPKRKRVVLKLRHLKGRKYKQIAKLLGLTYRQVLRDISQSHTALRAALDDERQCQQRSAEPARRDAA